MMKPVLISLSTEKRILPFMSCKIVQSLNLTETLFFFIRNLTETLNHDTLQCNIEIEIIPS